MISKNYGLAGGTLDSTELIKAAIPRLITQQEKMRFEEKLRGRLLFAAELQSGRAKAKLN